MATDALKVLEEQLGAPPPVSLARLGEDRLHDLADAIHNARRQQAIELAAAGDQALRHVPRLLRGPVRRVLA